MATQTTYATNISPPGPGTLAGNVDNARIATRIAETASPGIPFGRAVGIGTLSDQGAVLGAATAAAFRGISLRDVTLRGDLAVVDAYLPPNSMGVLESGEVWVEPGEAVAVADPVYFVPATGVFMKTVGTNVLVANARWKTSCGVGGRAIVQLFGTNA
jgi:hypothetical protein